MGNESVSRKELKELDRIFGEPAEIDKWMGYLKQKELNFYTWIQERSGGAISHINKHLDLKISDANGLAHTLLCAFLGGWLISYMKRENKIKEMLKTPEKEFERWLDGKLPSTFYNYSIKGIDNSDALYRAKTTHINLLKKAMEKKQEKKKDMERFEEVKRVTEKISNGKVESPLDNLTEGAM